MTTAALLAFAPRSIQSVLDSLPKVDAHALTGDALEAQIQFDLLLRRTPSFLATGLVGFAVLLVLFGRHSQRLLAGALLAAELAAFTLLWWAPREPGSPLPALLLVVGGAAALAGGVAWTGVATGLALGLALGAAGGLAALAIAGIPVLWLGVPFALLGFFLGLGNVRRLSVWLPPLCAALALTLGLARLLGPHYAGAAVPQLAELPIAAALLAAALLLFLALSLAREELHKRRAARRDAMLSDEKIKEKLAADRKRFANYLGGSDSAKVAPK